MNYVEGMENKISLKLRFTLKSGLKSRVNRLAQNNDGKSSHCHHSQDYRLTWIKMLVGRLLPLQQFHDNFF